MKKLILFTYILSIISFAVFSQSLTISNGDTLLSNNATVNVSGNFNSTVSISTLKVKNTSAGTLNVKVRRVTLDSVVNSTNSFCFAGSCFGPTTYVSPSTATINASAIDASFIGDYYPNGKAGATTVLYTFYNLANLQDTVCVKVIYLGIDNTGVNDIHKSDIVFRDAYPNPANNVATFSYALPKQTNSAKIVLRNLLGAEVMSTNLEELNGKKTISTSDIKEGIYFYSLIVNEKVFYTRKLVVKH